jgi:hypothetical protein
VEQHTPGFGLDCETFRKRGYITSRFLRGLS